MRADAGAGFALPAALFLLVVLGGLAAWLLRITELGEAQGMLELEGERAYLAAEAGLEAGLYAAAAGGCDARTVSFGGALARFHASVSCTRHSADEGGVTLTWFEVVSVACNQPLAGACPNPAPSLPEYAERHVRAVLEGG